MQAASLVALLLALSLTANAQLSSVPNLSSPTQTGDSTSKNSGQTTSNTAQQTTTNKQTTTNQQTTTNNDQSQATQITGAPKIPDGSSSTGGNDLANPTNKLSGPVTHLTGAPTLAGVGIPTLVIPYTANAPFMQKSALPQGTFFIAVGAVLAFLGACVLLWRLMIAWSINRSVKRTAMLASMHNEKGGRTTSSYWGGSSSGGYNRMASSGGGKGGGYYKDIAVDSTVSLDNLTNTGKPMKPHFRDSVVERNSPSTGAPPANLFFSPTAQAASQRDSTHQSHRNSGYMPSGFYASPSAQAGGGNSSIAIGGNLAPGSYGNTNRHSGYSAASAPSPPASPGPPPQSRGSYRHSASRDSMGLRVSSRDGLRAQSRDGLGDNRNSAYLYAQPSSSSLMVGHQSSSDLAGSRAPSAYLEELFDNHGSGPRERF
jgi:hypothetical protein